VNHPIPHAMAIESLKPNTREDAKLKAKLDPNKFLTGVRFESCRNLLRGVTAQPLRKRHC